MYIALYGTEPTFKEEKVLNTYISRGFLGSEFICLCADKLCLSDLTLNELIELNINKDKSRCGSQDAYALGDQHFHINDAHYFDVNSANEFNAFKSELRVIHSIPLHFGIVEAIEIFECQELKVFEWQYLDDNGILIYQ